MRDDDRVPADVIMTAAIPEDCQLASFTQIGAALGLCARQARDLFIKEGAAVVEVGRRSHHGKISDLRRIIAARSRTRR
jgi:hypothetical protein